MATARQLDLDPAPTTNENEIFRRATEVIGSDAKAMRWMGNPVRALNYATPISLIHDPKGVQSVLTVLGRLEHSVY
jgi:putative toxin-antitoxin system antitoxin component (TIGR02293 family)